MVLFDKVFDIFEVIYSSFKKNRNECNEDKYFFVHVPKTAGTSFRKSLAEKFVLIGDYGVDSPVTSRVVKQFVYTKPDRFMLKMQFIEGRAQWITGHAPIYRYLDFVSAKHVFTFVRNPIEQILSHYNHFAKHSTFQGTLEDFINDEKFQNVQAKTLNVLPVSLIGYVGITEKYYSSLSYIQSVYKMDFSFKQENVNTKKEIEVEQLSDDVLAKLVKFNCNDLKLYNSAIKLHEQRQLILKNGKDWTYSHILVNKNGLVTGCAYFLSSNDAVDLSIIYNSKHEFKLCADSFYGDFPKANFPRQRYIGFQINMPQYFIDFSKIKFKVRSTGQELEFVLM